MCGIWGFVSSLDNKEYVQKMYEAAMHIQPRGPERTTIKQSSISYLVFHRLAINGLSESNDQPYIYEEPEKQRKIVVMCNGEIYNFPELKQRLQNDYPQVYDLECDTSIIYYLLKHLKYDFYKMNKQLQGEYALAVIVLDKHEKPLQLYLSTDECSVRPMFYAYDKSSKSVIFSSLLVGITLFSNTITPMRLDGGSIKYFDLTSGAHAEKLYVDWYPKQLDSSMCLVDISSLLVRTFEGCIKRRMMSDRPIGCFLSGGLDSSLVAALVAKELKKTGQRLHTFSIGDENSSDVINAQLVATHINSIHTHVPFQIEQGVAYLDEVIKATETFDITTIRASVGQYLISKYIAENTDIKVVFSGDGADEAEMGYLYFYKAPSADAAQEESRKLLQQIHLYDGLRVDRCVSIHGLEARVPYLDWEFVKLLLQIPAFYKAPKLVENDKSGNNNHDSRYKCEKWLLRQAFGWKYPHLLPSCVLWRTKETFSDSLSTEKNSFYEAILRHVNAYTHHMCSSLVQYSHCPPTSVEGRYYRERFHQFFGLKAATVIPRVWMPQWVSTTDPSARSMKEVYGKAQNV